MGTRASEELVAVVVDRRLTNPAAAADACSMAFVFTRSARDKARSGLRFATIAVPVAAGLLYLTISRELWLAAGVLGLFGVLAGFGSFMAVVMAVLLLRAGGAWRIEVTESALIWASPTDAVDPSFEIALADIDHVLIEVEKVRPDGTDDIDDYFLVRRDGRAVKLNKVSGVSLEDLVEALTAEGIETQRHLGHVRIVDGQIERRPPKRSQRRASA